MNDEFKPPFTEKDNAQPRRPRSPMRLVILALIGIVIVLAVAHLDALLRPLRILGTVLIPINIGLILAYLLNPFLRFFERKAFRRIKRKRLNRALSMLVTYLVLFAIIAGLVWLIVPQTLESLNDISANGLAYITRLVDSINGFVESLHLPLPQNDGEQLVSLEKLLTFAVDLFSRYGTSLISNIGSIAGGTLTVLKNILIGIFISIYVLLAKDRLNAMCRRVIHAFLSEKHEKMLLHYIGTADVKFGGFLIGKIIDSFFVGLSCGILFTIFKIPYPILIAVIIGVTDFIPFFGPFIGAIPSAIIIFIASPVKAVLFVVLILIVQQIDGNLIAPLILGDRTGLTSLGVLVAVTVTGGVLGIMGMVIGVPLFALIMVVLDDFLCNKLRAKQCSTSIYDYYSQDAYLRPADEIRHRKTMTQKFVDWVVSVETEKPGVDYKPSKWHSFWALIRRGFLYVGGFFHSVFSTKPLPKDRTGSIYNSIALHGMNTGRTIWRVLLFSVGTVLIYPVYLIELIAESTNIACHHDGRRTWGAFAFLSLGVLTIGIYPLIWHCQVIRRYQTYCAAHGETSVATVKHFLLWGLLGLPTIVGPFIAIARFLKAFNQMGRIFNAEHTFPLEHAPQNTKESKKDPDGIEKQGD